MEKLKREYTTHVGFPGLFERLSFTDHHPLKKKKQIHVLLLSREIHKRVAHLKGCLVTSQICLAEHLSCDFAFRGPIWNQCFIIFHLCVCVCVQSFSYVWLFRDLSDCSPSGSSVHGILQARILGWVTISYFRASSQPRDGILVSFFSCIDRQILYHCTTWTVAYYWNIRELLSMAYYWNIRGLS